MELTNIPCKIDPLLWWKSEEKVNFRDINEVALKYLNIQGTLVPAECVLSAAGNIVTAKRSKLKDANVGMYVFLTENLK